MKKYDNTEGSNEIRGGSSRITNLNTGDTRAAGAGSARGADHGETEVFERYDDTTYIDRYDRGASSSRRDAGVEEVEYEVDEPADDYVDCDYSDREYADDYAEDYADDYAEDYADEYVEKRAPERTRRVRRTRREPAAAAAGAGAGVAAAGAGAGAAGGAAGSSSAVAAGGLPKRGLAMILIAVAALLLLWGIYAMSKNIGGDRSAAPAPTTDTAATASNGTDAEDKDAKNTATATATVTSGQPRPGQDPNQQNQPGQPGQPGGDQNRQSQSGQPGQPDQPGQSGQPGDPNQPAPAPAPTGDPLTAQSAEVFVYNNSGVANAAADTAARLDSQYSVANSANAAEMNLPEQQYGIFDNTYVFYDPQVAGAEAMAAEVAQRVGGTPRAVNDVPPGTTLPREVTQNGKAIAVVLAG